MICERCEALTRFWGKPKLCFMHLRVSQASSHPELAAIILAAWELHDLTEKALTEAERNGGYNIKFLWEAHDLMERATIKLHAMVTPEELAALEHEE